ncbi:MAG: hypothetical protein WCO71_12600, partial [Pseudomonadota bacterium]
MLPKRNKYSLELSGELGSESTFEDVFREMQAIFKETNKPVELNVNGLERGNSIGILSWIQALDQWKIPVIYQQVPTWLVEQFNAIEGFFPEGSRIESFFARFFNTASGDTVPLFLRVGD